MCDEHRAAARLDDDDVGAVVVVEVDAEELRGEHVGRVERGVAGVDDDGVLEHGGERILDGEVVVGPHDEEQRDVPVVLVERRHAADEAVGVEAARRAAGRRAR